MKAERNFVERIKLMHSLRHYEHTLNVMHFLLACFDALVLNKYAFFFHLYQNMGVILNHELLAEL